MIERILLAVDDSPDALAASRLGAELAVGLGGELRVIHVLPDHEIDALLQTGATELDLAARRTSSATSVLARAADLAKSSRVPVSTVLRQGEVARAVLDEAHAWRADLVIVGRSFRSVSGEPYVGPQTRQILELANRPVLVVPPHQGGPTART
ncbi:MAG: universal stress protein [Nocardioides sp.]